MAGDRGVKGHAVKMLRSCACRVHGWPGWVAEEVWKANCTAQNNKVAYFEGYAWRVPGWSVDL